MAKALRYLYPSSRLIFGSTVIGWSPLPIPFLPFRSLCSRADDDLSLRLALSRISPDPRPAGRLFIGSTRPPLSWTSYPTWILSAFIIWWIDGRVLLFANNERVTHRSVLEWRLWEQLHQCLAHKQQDDMQSSAFQLAAHHLVPQHEATYNRNWKDEAVRERAIAAAWVKVPASVNELHAVAPINNRTACIQHNNITVSRSNINGALALVLLYKWKNSYPNHAAFGRHGLHWHVLLLATCF